MSRKTIITLIVVVFLALMVGCDILLGIYQTGRARCSDISDPRYDPPRETCGVEMRTIPIDLTP